MGIRIGGAISPFIAYSSGSIDVISLRSGEMRSAPTLK